MVSIRLKNNDKGSNFGDGHTCGGTLIGRNKILTAAHCIYNKKTKKFRKAGDFQVVMGTINRYKKTNETLVYKVSKIAIPSSYKGDDFKDDVAVMFIKGSVPENYRYIIPIPMNHLDLKRGTLCSVTGWGSLREAGIMPSLLQTVEVPIVDTKTCNKAYFISGGLATGQLCAGYFEGGRDSCQGDSGGPLVCNGFLAGVVSYGNGCANLGFPGVYSNVTYYKKWIDEQNGGNLLSLSVTAALLSFVLLSTL
ncbi:hypothetical protein ACFFRR_007296 [Megaselia abdita]